MAVGTNVRIEENDLQFRGIYSRIWVVRFNLDTANISGNSEQSDTVAVPGIVDSDHILSWSRYADPDHSVIRTFHTTTNSLHCVTHNPTGGAVNPVAADLMVIIARPVNP